MRRRTAGSVSPFARVPSGTTGPVDGLRTWRRVRRVSAPEHRPLPPQTGPPPPRERALARIPLYPVLVGVALIAGTFIQRDVSASAAVRTLGVAAVLGAVLSIVFAAITRSWHAGALIAAPPILVVH